MNYLILIFASVVITVLWIRYRSARKISSEPSSSPVAVPSEQELVRIQADFERRLETDYDLPDGVRGRDAYIYWSLMRKWFSSLAAIHRYDDEYVRKLRRDWCDYIELLPRAKTLRFLALEGDNDKAALYDQEAEQASRSIELIQNAFAASIGEEAIQELQNVRNRNYDAFDRSGRRPMAPVGHRYFPTSISPYIEELMPVVEKNAH